ncbi:unnamed protein product [Gongylonema pulchrum]|uniref:Ribosome biogenesis regulatory protein n=1 Tax=Gongylonema pulchrum TaxID=637853 RepID=A0A183DNQ9_9BILA|nr:unnamed protein product [Gongylonema pulchrum]
MEEKTFSGPIEEELSARVRENAQFLFNKIWELERIRVDEAICAKEWKARYGYKRARNETDDWLIEIPDNKDPMIDYFEERMKAKKERVNKNEMQRLRNIARSKTNISSANTAPLGVTAELNDRTRHELVNQINRARFATASHDPMVDYFEERMKAKKERVNKNEMQRLRNIARSKTNISSANTAPLGVTAELNDRTRHELVNQINRARFATASHGAFQPEVKNEKKLLKTGKHHKYEPNEASVSDERKKQLEILEKISSKKQPLNQARLPMSQQNEVDSREKNAGKKHGKGLKRSKSAVHRQKHFQNQMKKMKKPRGDIRKGKKQKKGRGSK